MADEKDTSAVSMAKNFLDRFTLSQKIFLGSVIVLTIVGIMLVVNMAGSFNYGVLYANLSPKDSGLVLEQLKAAKVPYKIEGGGSVIKVPDGRISELRIELAADGLPEGGGVGFEIFDKSSLSTTDFVQNINYIRAIEGELARTISELREVNSAKVHITMPKRSVFIDEQEDAKASIVLKLRPGARVSANIIPAILHLTAQSVEGLKPDNIAIVDIHGTLLSRPKGSGDDMFAELSSGQMAYQKKMESGLTRKIVNLLEPHVGSGKVRANVRLKLDFNKIESTEETVDPNTIAKVSEKTETSSSSGGVKAGGIPGVASNVGQASGGGTPGSRPGAPSKAKSEKSLVNYEVSKKITRTTRPVGEITQLSVAVMVDDAVNVQVQDGDLVRQPQKRTADELATIRRIVQAAVGFESQRGDVIEVANLSFDTSTETVSEFYQDKQQTRDLVNTLTKYGGYALALFLLIFVIIKPLSRKVNQIVKESRLPKATEIEIPRVDSEKMVALQDAREEAEIENELMEKYKVPKSTKKMGYIRQKVKDFAEENIDGTATLVKSFLIED
ncbi:MAG: flagellar M-ring protein FliF [bacterium]|nr:flagellar M-ring protein FliF [bacterium]